MLFVGCPTGGVAWTASSHVASRAVRKPASCVLLVLLSVQRLLWPQRSLSEWEQVHACRGFLHSSHAWKIA